MENTEAIDAKEEEMVVERERMDANEGLEAVHEELEATKVDKNGKKIDEKQMEKDGVEVKEEQMDKNDKEADEKDEEMEDNDSASGSSVFYSDNDEQFLSGEDDESNPGKPLSEEEIEELISDFLDVESKAAEAQEALEKESLTRVESEVREELAQTLQGDELDKAVATEMTAFREEWESVLDELETESASLLEQLDGAGIDLPKLYKLIESQARSSCYTDAWKRRAHWVGTQVTRETAEVVADAEKFLHTHRPVRKRHGKLLEEGASGFLEKKLGDDGIKESLVGKSELDWSSLNKVFSDKKDDIISFGSKHWASVYLASTPQQAAAMGLEFPGVNEVEEIDEIDASSADPFFADALENERELALSEEQKKNYRKVKEEDDVNVDRKLQLRLKRKRHRKRSKQGITRAAENRDDDSLYPNGNSNSLFEDKPHGIGIGRNKAEDQLQNSETDLQFYINEASKERNGNLAVPSESDEDKKASVSDTEEEMDTMSPEKKFQCTACYEVATEVHSHPLLKVIVCLDCKLSIESRLAKAVDCSERHCEWCGRVADLVSCKSCERLFCVTCIKRNVGEEYLSEAQSSNWDCCCCSPILLQRLTLELEKAMGKKKPIESSSSDSSSDSSSVDTDADIKVAVSSKRKSKKKIRRIIDDAELGEETRRKIAIEKERQERLKSLQFSARYKTMSSTGDMRNIPEGAETEVLGNARSGYIVNVAREVGEEAVRIPPSISGKLKAHQVTGIRFMWENIIQSINKVKSGDKGLGCILAHTMGLGKTFQVIAFLYTAMRCIDLGLKTALIVTPVNVLHNWRSEFMKWRPSEVKPLRIFMLEDVSRERRLELLTKWRHKGGVFLIGYSAFRNLSLGRGVKDLNTAKEICYALRDGPDILVCDEAHIIKNTRADTTQTLKQVKCQRRIALTGSPLQNNLMEYYCMVDFVREGFLGSSHEFRNRFQNPIENGQHMNSTAEDVKIMNQRSHILYEQLKGFVQRMDMSVVKRDLPPKTVFVISVKLSPLQRKLYKRFLKIYGFNNGRTDERMRKNFFAAYQVLAQVLNHPGILQLRKEVSSYGLRGNIVDIPDDCSSDENIDYNMVMGEKQRTMTDLLDKVDGYLQKDWWIDLLHKNNYKVSNYSGKMILLLDILSMCAHVGDKALVFSQSIPTLDLIELYLSKLPRRGKQEKFWKKGKDWYRIDGKTESSERQKLVEKFNEPENKRVKCTLISTRAGSLGINLYAANRVIIVDGSWNPTYDLQAIFRAWRYGQKKPVFAYRLMARGTIEEKIYKRQVTKEGLAARVVDRQQVHRTISKEEMLHLLEFDDDGDENSETQTTSVQAENPQKQKATLSNESCSSDKLMETLLQKHSPSWISNFHEHETLLQENEDEKLTKEEKDMAWEVYRRALEWEEVHRVPLTDSVLKPSPPGAPPPPSVPRQLMPRPKGFNRSRFVTRSCTNTSHQLTLISQGRKLGCNTICGECGREIRWEDVIPRSKLAC
ncbi:PREDICTED: protein CHROMATIN REMODELING 20 isoform X2 [Tarenaya hassleriana]|uniref:protein CHROMATIN REMODELING 20 isoform X2 n=1 Tax=Tarenaya hassleriana TaxID=28532 RepID=UPI00053C8303|nr:PREDICTED: protein CHROMATIN REMODELING 20 isoform X2 [Tarenaya hassleriana]